MKELVAWLTEVLPLLIGHTTPASAITAGADVDHLDKELPQFTVKAYWAGSIVRIDIQPKSRPGE